MTTATAPRSTAPAIHLRPYRFRSVALTHPGCVRKLNEDAVLDRPDIGLWAVADGMGGHAAGDFASAAVVRHLNAISTITSAFDFRRAVRAALLSANRELQEKADDELLDTIGATVVTLMVHRGHYACIWAGDSRAYRFRRGRLERLTRDHSLVQELVDAGSIQADEARGHTNSNIVTRAVGASERLDVDGLYGSIEPGDRFLLCSDGLGVVDEAEIERRLKAADIGMATADLMRGALDRAAPDNISVVLVEVEPYRQAGDAQHPLQEASGSGPNVLLTGSFLSPTSELAHASRRRLLANDVIIASSLDGASRPDQLPCACSGAKSPSTTDRTCLAENGLATKGRCS